MYNKNILKLPIYKKFSFLTGESLNYLSENFIKYIDSKYINYSDGIISGLDISYIEEKNKFKISKGLFKINSNVYFLTEEVYVSKPKKEGRYALILENNVNIDEEYKKIESNFIFKGENEIFDTDFIICNILLRDGAKIYEESYNFDEFSKEYNLINLTNQKYSFKNNENHTINPKILKKWANKMLKFKLDNLDINMIFNILNGNISYDLILVYINLKLRLNLDKSNNEELVKYFLKILKAKEKEDIKKEINNDEIITNFCVS